MHLTRCLGLLVLLLPLACSTPSRDRAASAAPGWSYTLTIDDPAEEVVAIEARFGELSARAEVLVLALPERYAFVQFAEPFLAGEIEARTAEDEPLAVVREAPYRWRVAKGGAREVRLSYRVPFVHRRQPAVLEREDGYDHPYLAPDHGLLVSAALLVAPVSVPFAATHVRFALPRGWNVLCPWPRTEDGAYSPADQGALQSDLVAIGAWATEVVRTGGMEITIAYAPGQDELARLATPVIRPLVEAELALFGVAPRAKYLFLFGRPEPRKNPGLTLAGSPKTGSMNLMVSGDAGDGTLAARIAHLIAHEFFHTWAQSRYATPPELRFVGEGFTDYYANLVPLRAGVTTQEDFARALGEALTKYEAAREKLDLSLVDAGGDVFFTDRNAYDAVYQGGLLLAAVLDRKIRARGVGSDLDELLRELNNDPRWSAESAPGLDDVIALVERHVDAAFAARFRELCSSRTGFDAVLELRAVGVDVVATGEPPPRPAWRVDVGAWRADTAR